MPWVLDEYDIGHMSYELSKLGAAFSKKLVINIALKKT